MVTDANFVVKKGLNVQDGDISIKGSNKELRFYEGSNYVGFEAPALSADKIWVLPNADGSTGQALKTDGSGNLGWASISTYTAGTNLTLSGTEFSVDDAFLKNNANDVTTGVITANGFTTAGSITLGGHSFDDIEVAGEFTDSDFKIMSSSAIADKIESYNYLTSVSAANVFSALNSDWGGDKTFGTQADDTATFTGAVVVGDGTQPISAGQLTVVQTDNDESAHTLLLMDNEDDATRGPIMTMYRNTASPAAGDRLGSIRFNGEDGGGFARDYAKIEANAVAVGAGSHTGQLIFSTTIGASITDVISIDGTTGGAYGGLLYNQSGIKELSNVVSATSTANNNYITLLEVPHATFKAIKASIHITDSSSNEVQTMDLICHYDGSSDNYSTYGIIYDGAAAIGDVEVDINSSNIRIRFQNTQGSTVNLAGSIHAVCHP